MDAMTAGFQAAPEVPDVNRRQELERYLHSELDTSRTVRRTGRVKRTALDVDILCGVVGAEREIVRYVPVWMIEGVQEFGINIEAHLLVEVYRF